ncbi:MAG: hypothetical protein K0U23_02850 [Gammaproteobacteria bacterium]|nr:hypothetical protein [Gammaproteobacteria bacterium]
MKIKVQLLKMILIGLWLGLFNITVVYAASFNTPAPISGRNSSSTQHIIPADVLARVKLLKGELNLVRIALGKPQHHQTIISVSGASPREVYFEAQALFQKANRLAYEVTGSYEQQPEIHSSNLLPAHVWQLVDTALKRILLVKQRLGIKTVVVEKSQVEATTPTDVFNAILQANQELNALLYRRVAPSDVYEQVTLAVNYTANLLKRLNISPRIPDSPTFVANKTPGNVYQRAVRCIHILQAIAKESNVKVLHVKISDLGKHQATPSNVFDLSKIIVSEVRYLNTLLGNTKSIEAFYPGYKTPSEVFQRAGVLLKQLQAIQKVVKQQPNWLNQQGLNS